MSGTDISGIVVGNTTAIVGVGAAVLVYFFRHWWEESKRLSQKREEAYLLLGEASQGLEIATILLDEAKMKESFYAMIKHSTPFHLYASPEVQSKVTAYLDGVKEVILSDASDPKLFAGKLEALNPLRTSAANAMRKDVLRWSVLGLKDKWLIWKNRGAVGNNAL